MQKEDLDKFVSHLDKTDTKYLLTNAGKDKVNIFFGNPLCLRIIEQFSTQELNNLTPYEDCLLGIMLGYSRQEQYSRFLSKSAA